MRSTARHPSAQSFARARRLTSTALIAGCLLLLPSLAGAHNVDGRFGVGFEETLTGVGQRFAGTDALQRAAGLSLRYFFGHLGIEAVLGGGVHRPGDIPVRRSPDQVSDVSPELEYAAFASVGTLYNIFRSPQVNMAIGLRALFAVGRQSVGCPSAPEDCPADTGSAGPTRVGLAFEIPLRAEYFFTPTFAIAGAFGPVVEWNLSEISPLTGRRDSRLIDVTRGDFSGGLGFTWYFE